MTLVTLPFRPKPGETEDITQIMANFDAILAVLNGGLGSDNISPSAAVPVAKLAPGADGQIIVTVAGVPTWGSVALPVGTILPYAMATAAPDGFLLCDGSANGNRVTHQALWDLFRQGGSSSPWGNGDGSTTFNTPNLKGRVPVGVDTSQTEFNAVNKPGGTKIEALDINKIPSHNHAGSFVGAADRNLDHYHGMNHDHTIQARTSYDASSPNSIPATSSGSYVDLGGGGSGAPIKTFFGPTGGASINLDHLHSLTVAAQGNGSAPTHPNLQPYVVVSYVIKY